MGQCILEWPNAGHVFSFRNWPVELEVGPCPGLISGASFRARVAALGVAARRPPKRSPSLDVRLGQIDPTSLLSTQVSHRIIACLR